MTNVILVAHILVSVVLVIVVLMQRSEGGALGIGGGGGGGGAGGGLMSGTGVNGALVRTTIIFGAIFFVSSLTLTIMATHDNADNRTDVQRELEGSVPTDAETDGINLNDFDDVLSGDSALLDDPLAVTPSETAPSEVTEPVSDDPLASDSNPQ